MRQRFLFRFHSILLIMVYITAITIAVILFIQTLLMARYQVLNTTDAVVPMIIHTTTAPKSDTIASDSTLPPTSTLPTPALEHADITITSYHPKTGRYIAAWLPPWFSAVDLEASPYKDVIDEISPFWYSTDGSGRLYGTRNDELVQAAHTHNIQIIPTIHNVGDPSAVVTLLSNSQRRARHAQLVVDEVLARGYDGIDIDYESLPSSLRPGFSAFIKDLAEMLHAQNKLLTVAVHAKDKDYGGLGGYQDWVEIGQYVDRLRIMTYDYSWRGSGPGPVAPRYWVQSVAEYAKSVVDPAKVVIGIPFYGYDWPPHGNARALPWGDIEDLISEQGITLRSLERDNRGPVDESYFSYNAAQGTRTVWFMSGRSLESKLELVLDMDLAGIAIWRIGYEKPEYWDIIRLKLVEDPILIQRAINPLLPSH